MPGLLVGEPAVSSSELLSFLLRSWFDRDLRSYCSALYANSHGSMSRASLSFGFEPQTSPIIAAHVTCVFSLVTTSGRINNSIQYRSGITHDRHQSDCFFSSGYGTEVCLARPL